MTALPREAAQRRADAEAMFEARHADVWVASSSEDGRPHLVPLSYCWHDGLVVIAVESSSATAVNLSRSGVARLGFGATRDVVMVDATIVDTVDVATSPEVAGRYAEQADWDPREIKDGYVFLVLRPRRIQVWREVNEIAGRTVMRDGVWLV